MDVLWQVDAPTGNYYGGPRVTAWSDGTFTLDTENWDGWSSKSEQKQVSAAFAKAWKKEFGAKKRDA